MRKKVKIARLEQMVIEKDDIELIPSERVKLENH